MIADWETDTAVFADLLPQQFPRLWDRLSGLLGDHGVTVHLARGCRDIWARDFLPVQVGDGFVSFRYAPDYLRGFDELRTDDAVCDSLPFLAARRTSELVMDGGNLVSSGTAVVLTDKAYREPGQLPPHRRPARGSGLRRPGRSNRGLPTPGAAPGLFRRPARRNGPCPTRRGAELPGRHLPDRGRTTARVGGSGVASRRVP